MKASLLKNIRRPEKGNKGKFNYKIVTFMVCLLLATILWFMNALSKNYDERLKFIISYENVPEKLYPSSGTIQIKVNTSGYHILAYKLGINDPTIKIDASQFRHNSFYASNTQRHIEKLQEQLGDAVQVNEVQPDTLFLRTQPDNTEAN